MANIRKLLIIVHYHHLSCIFIKIMPVTYSYEEYADMIFCMNIATDVPPAQLGNISDDTQSAILQNKQTFNSTFTTSIS